MKTEASFNATSGVMIHGSLGRHWRTASEKVECGISCSNSKTSFSVSLSPISPSLLTKWPWIAEQNWKEH